MNQITGADILAMRHQAAEEENYAILCRANIDRLTQAYLAGNYGEKTMEWIATAEKTHPDKPGLERYEQVPCLIVRKREIFLRQWNCEHLVWDGEDGDDFYCEAKDVTHWMPLPALPSNVELTGAKRPVDCRVMPLVTTENEYGLGCTI